MGASQCCGIQSPASCSDHQYCCDIQEEPDSRGGHRILIHVPAGFTHPNTTSYKFKSFPNDDQHDISFKQQKSAGKDMIRVSDAIRSTPSGGSIHILDGSLRSSGVRSSSSLIEVPAPLNDWTKEEQQIFIDILDEFPKAGRNPTQMELAIVKAKKLMPLKSVYDIQRCFKHLRSSRVAYFGR